MSLAAFLTTFFLLGMGGAAGSARVERPASEEKSREYELKAAVLYNIIKYVDWPKEVMGSSTDPITVLVIGENPFGATLENVLQKREAHGHRIVVRYSKGLPKKLNAQVVFMKGLSKAERGKLKDLCAASSAMLIGDREGLAKEGACLGFYLKDRRVRFEINVDALKRARLSASSELLKLARIIKEKKSASSPGEELDGGDTDPQSRVDGPP